MFCICFMLRLRESFNSHFQEGFTIHNKKTRTLGIRLLTTSARRYFRRSHIFRSTNINHKGLQRTANEYVEERRIYKDLISKNNNVDILNSASRILQCWSYYVRSSAYSFEVLCSPLWLMFAQSFLVFQGFFIFVFHCLRNSEVCTTFGIEHPWSIE